VISGWPEAVGLRRYEILDSTNEEARRLARAGEQGPCWIVAAQQSAGRGRHGRPWVSQQGNLFATLLTETASSRSAQAGFVAGISVADVVSEQLRGVAAKLKWPNDVLISGRKAAGILVEHVSDRLIAVGIGINLAHCPDGVNAVSIAGVTGSAPDPGEVLTRLAWRMLDWMAVWRDDGFGPIRDAWIARAGGVGDMIRAVTAQRPYQGIFEDLDRDGALLLRDENGTSHRITAADVFYGC
jgi:BirA family biotin operon repressor/biotin-[acetyl-CoA-carboxylase] ligase